ncbi:MAG TPA: UbiX family flavin prenyltransferase [Bacteroidia bacterium]|nr:UbiX family flavin prenyltransferase [Bacteroidia bacterium]HNT79100.1 UbiX family flavin prenyltransferase [Bacteroidia bacterium]
MSTNNKIVLAVSGASGSLYAKVLMDKLSQLHSQWEEVAILMSTNAKEIWKQEIGVDFVKPYGFSYYDKYDFNAPFASGSSSFKTMIVCPCSMGTLGRIAAGVSDDLTTRAADVMLKERRKLILVTRDTPLSLIHINNMKTVTESGAIVLPASPSFYSKPNTFEQLISSVADRIIDLIGLQQETYRWNEKT